MSPAAFAADGTKNGGGATMNLLMRMLSRRLPMANFQVERLGWTGMESNMTSMNMIKPKRGNK